eukprot:2830151-Amphidinium_carterae.2
MEALQSYVSQQWSPCLHDTRQNMRLIMCSFTSCSSMCPNAFELGGCGSNGPVTVLRRVPLVHADALLTSAASCYGCNNGAVEAPSLFSQLQRARAFQVWSCFTQVRSEKAAARHLASAKQYEMKGELASAQEAYQQAIQLRCSDRALHVPLAWQQGSIHSISSAGSWNVRESSTVHVKRTSAQQCCSLLGWLVLQALALLVDVSATTMGTRHLYIIKLQQSPSSHA